MIPSRRWMMSSRGGGGGGGGLWSLRNSRGYSTTSAKRPSLSGGGPLNAVLIGGSGFIGSRLSSCILNGHPDSIVHVVSRGLKERGIDRGNDGDASRTVYHSMDMSKSDTFTDYLPELLVEADVVINLIGIMYGTAPEFMMMQAETPHRIAESINSIRGGGDKPNFIHVSAIGADSTSMIPYAQSKALGEQKVLDVLPNAMIVRPSLVFGPQDDFFNRFNRLADFLPFLPVFGGGCSRFQPVSVDDVSDAIYRLALLSAEGIVSNKSIYELGGPDILTYREIMELVLSTSKKNRIILPLPWWMGQLQASFLEKLPYSLFTITRDQLKLLENDNIVHPKGSVDDVHKDRTVQTFEDLDINPVSVRDILPTYLAPK